MDNGYGVFLGLDVGKGEHHGVGLDPAGKRLHDKPLPNSEPKLREVFDRLAEHGRILVVVDQPNTIGALLVAVARACGHEVAYLPGLAMRRIADLYPGSAKTDARDAFVIADAARTLPHTLRRVDVGDDALAELDVLVGYDDDLAAEATRISNSHPWPAHRYPPSSRACTGSPGHPPGGAGDPVFLRRPDRYPRRRAPHTHLDRGQARAPDGHHAGRVEPDRVE
jgi:hypothetical protein